MKVTALELVFAAILHHYKCCLFLFGEIFLAAHLLLAMVLAAALEIQDWLL